MVCYDLAYQLRTNGGDLRWTELKVSIARESVAWLVMQSDCTHMHLISKWE